MKARRRRRGARTGDRSALLIGLAIPLACASSPETPAPHATAAPHVADAGTGRAAEVATTTPDAGSEPDAARYPCDPSLMGLYRYPRRYQQPEPFGGERRLRIDCVALYCVEGRMTGWVTTITTTGYSCEFEGTVRSLSNRLVFHVPPKYTRGPTCLATAERTADGFRFTSFGPDERCHENHCEHPGDDDEGEPRVARLPGTELPFQERIPIELVNRRNICDPDLPEDLRRLLHLE